jgi:hypothetical protein
MRNNSQFQDLFLTHFHHKPHLLLLLLFSYTSHQSNSMEKSPSSEAVTQLALYGNRSFVTVFTATDPCPKPDASSPHLPTSFPDIHSNIISPSTPRSSELFLPFTFPDQNFVCTFTYPMRATWHAHLILLYLITL